MPKKTNSFHKTVKRCVVFSALAAIASACLSMTAVQGANNSVTLVVGGKKAAFEVSPYVTNSGTVMAPVDYVKLLGAAYSLDKDGTLYITTATGRTFATVFQNINDRYMVPLQSTALALGAATSWSPSSQTFTLLAKLEMAQVADDKLNIATSYPVYYKSQLIDNPPRLVVDVYGANLDCPPATIPSNSSLVNDIRSGQMDAQTVRLVLDLPHPVHYQVASTLQTNDIQLALNTSQTNVQPAPSYSDQPPSTEVAANDDSTNAVPSKSQMIPLPQLSDTASTQNNTTAPSTKIVDVEYKSTAPNIYQVVVTTAGPTDSASNAYRLFALDHPNRLAFDVANSVLSLADAATDTLNSIIPQNNPLFHSIRWGMVEGSAASNGRVVLDLLQPVVTKVDTATLPDGSGVQYTITVESSSAAYVAGGSSGNSIAGKIVVVDAGHGGKDTGAPGAGGIYEKNFTLAIAKLVRDALVAAGATPIMTRSDDTFIPLSDRSQMGIDAHADYFISIHCDSSGEQNSHSGDTVYYHGDDATCRALARSIASRLGQLDIAIQSDGVKSDYVRFPGVGFSVLRKSPEPAVLCECGYVNDDSDAKCLEDPASLSQIATAIVAGLRDFVSNQ